MYKVYLFLLLACLCLLAEAQLTFTSSWGGKRSAGPMGPMGPVMQMGSMGPIPPCKNDDAIAAIHKMIQTEAERLILCQKS